MKIRNIFKNTTHEMQTHEDDRGIISDIFYKENIQHSALIESKPNVIRGNHYHKETTQHMIMTQGSLEYWYKKYGSNEDAKCAVLKKGDYVKNGTPLFFDKKNEKALFVSSCSGTIKDIIFGPRRIVERIEYKAVER